MPQIKVPPEGPRDAKILFVGEAPGKTEEATCRPFVGAAGIELTRMLNEAGILRSEVFITNVCKYRPPDNDLELWLSKKPTPHHTLPALGGYADARLHDGIEELKTEVAAIQPNLIVPLGNIPLQVITGNTGITKWRGSLLHSLPSFGERKVLPTYHPAAILRQWNWRWIALHDLRRVAKEGSRPDFPSRPESFIVRPGLDQVMDALEHIPSRTDFVAADIETSHGQIACLGLAWSEWEAICIPFYSRSGTGFSYWTEEEEFLIVSKLRQLLTGMPTVGQNWTYDQQYIARQWGFLTPLRMDTMLMHHVHFPGLPKGLDFLSSMYRDNHIYWKDEGKEFDERAPEEQLWVYNCRDAVATYEITKALEGVRQSIGLRSTRYGSPPDIQHRMFPLVLEAMLRGVRINDKLRKELVFHLTEEEAKRQTWLNAVVGRPLNPRSHKQLKELFYDELGCSVITNRKTQKPTTDSDALESFGRADPLLRPLCSAINQIRQLSNFRSVCLQPIDHDGRIRCSYNIAGTGTFRFASSSDAFGYGTNLQNISSGSESNQDFPLPNLRKLFIPDTGYTLGDFDLAQADARVVAWDAQDPSLMELFADPSRDLHNENTEVIFGRCLGKSDPNRQLSKTGVHLTNYGGTPQVLATALGITRHEAERFQAKWFSAHPAIREWHRRISLELQSRRYVENAFGYRRFYFDRIEGILKEALAWIPQSTVAITTNLGIEQVVEELRQFGVQFLLQVHDSSVFQWPSKSTDWLLPKIRHHLAVEIPYSTPLVIPVGSKVSSVSWGDCK
jgi:uracil-DNA glycosylase